MVGRRTYICPNVEVCSLLPSDVFMLQASLHDEEADFVGAKEQNFDFDDWPTDPWEDHIWQEEEKTDIWND